MAEMTTRLMELKARIFCHGVRVSDELWREITDENHYRHKRAGVSNGRFFTLRDGLSFTVVNAPVLEPFVKKSPLWLAKEGERYRIYDGDTALTDCAPFPWPKWYARSTSDGTPMSMVCSAHSSTSLYTAIYQGGCDFFSGGNECQFCAMKIDNKLQWRRVEQIAEVALAAREENPAAEISFGGGTRLTPDRSARHDAEAIAKFRSMVDMPVCVEMAPPDTDDWIDRLRDAGTDSIMFNLELWSPEARQKIMPGKAKITRERYLDAMRHGVEVFGENQVSSQVLIGLEPVSETLEAIRAIADAGAIPLPVVFRPLANTPLVDHPTPPVTDVLSVFAATYELMHARSLSGGGSRAGCALCGACSAHR